MIVLLLLSFISVQFNAPEIVTKSGNTILKVDGCTLYGEPGYPLLPVKTVFVVADSLKIKVYSRKMEGKYHIMPAQKAVPILHPELFRETPENKRAYSSDVIPAKPYRIMGTRHLLGVKVVELVLYPITYIPSKDEVIFNYKFDIMPVENFHPRVLPDAFKILQHVVLNPEALEITKSVDTTYLIITSSSLAPYFEPLLEWKREKGIIGKIVTTESIYASQFGRDNAEKIRNYIKTARNSGIVYVLLGGDTDVIPARFAYAMDAGTGNPSDNDIPADLYYSDLDGNWDANGNGVFGEVADSIDMLPDVIVGRAPVSTPSEVTNFVNKVISYERDHRSDYFTNALFMASYLDGQTDGGVAKDMVSDAAELEPVKLYERFGNLTRSSAIYYLGRGANIVNHDGHGSTYLLQTGNDYLNPQDFDALTNGPHFTGVFYSLGCWTCAIDHDCIAEHFVKSPQGGGFYIGNSRYGWYIPGFPGYSSSDQFDVEFFRNLAHTSNISGVALALTKALFAPYADGANDFRWSEYDLTYLGDPEMNVFIQPPTTLSLEYDGNFYEGINSVELRIVDANGPVKDARVSFIQNDSLLFTTTTNSMGIARGVFEIPGFDSLHVTVFHPTHTFLDVAYNVFSRGNFPDVHTNLLFADNHEDTLRLTFFNVSSSQSSLMNLALSGTFPLYPEVDSITIPSLNPGDSISISVPVNIYPVNGDTISSLILSGDTTYTVRIGVLKGRVEIADYHYTSLVRGGFGNLTLRFRNPLDVDVWNIKVAIVSLDPRIDPSMDTVNIQHLAAHSFTEITFQILVGPSADTLFFSPIRVGKDTVWLSVGYTGYHFSFETGLEGWTVQGGHWHRTTYRASDGSYSLYVGDESNHRYPPNFVASLISPPLVVPDHAELRFDTYYEAQPGWDFCMVSIISGDSSYYLATFSGPSYTWRTYTYRLDSFNPGDTIRLKYTFYSEDNSVQYEGWYIDNVGLNCSSVATSVLEPREKQITWSKIVLNDRLTMAKPGDYLLYDITGKKVLTVHNKQTIDLKNLPRGIYFITGIKSSRPVGKILLLR